VVACQEDQLDQGIGLARRALEHGPPQARVHNLLGKALERKGDHLEAVKSFDAAIALDPGFAEAHGNRANILAAAGLADQALAGFDRALALDPKAVADWINRGVLLSELGRNAEALESYDRALALAPDDATVLMNRAGALAQLGRYGEAEAGYDRVIRREPKYQLAYTQKGLAVKYQGRFAEARDLLTQAQAMNPKHAETSFALGQMLLLMGDWRAGWPLFEARALLPVPAYTAPDFPRWGREAPGDFRLLIVSEHDFADNVHFGRFAAYLAGRGHDVTLLTQPQLAPLMRSLPGIEKVITHIDELAGDKRRVLWHPLLSSMSAFYLTPDTVPAQEPYLRAEPERMARWAEKLGGGGFKVGLYWRGATRESAVPLAALAPLDAVPGLRLISLQKQPGAAELSQAPFGGKIEQVLDAADFSAEGLLDTAAVMAHLDAVVSIDALPAHLAGALGRPVLLALPAVPDWRWLLNRDHTPWYPSTRLYRQRQPGDWSGVFEAIAEELRARAGA
jgi:tetratricopeptide (TPR) repeat protein